MQDSQVNRIPNFIWGIADDVLRDLYVRGKYRDIILPMTVIRRLDAALEPTKQAVLAMRDRLDEDGVIEQEAALEASRRARFLQRISIYFARSSFPRQSAATSR